MKYIHPKIIFPILALIWLISIYSTYPSGIDRAYFLIIATFPFSLLALLVSEMVGGEHVNTLATVFLVATLILEAYFLGGLVVWLWHKIRHMRYAPR